MNKIIILFFLSKQGNINQKLRIEEHFTQTTEKATP